jgi:hypothetical protein
MDINDLTASQPGGGGVPPPCGPVPEAEGHSTETFFVEVEAIEHPWSTPTITVAEIRRLGNLPSDQPVIEVDPDNTERTLSEGDLIHLKPGHRYGKKVRFKRG